VWHFVTIFRNDEDVRFLEADRTPLQEGETLAVVPAIAGG
jgi:molybdopterin synthase sulfur carrier subunit